MSGERLIMATRRSALALAQARAFARELGQVSGVTVEELLVVTTGDKVTATPLSEVGGKGLFTKEIEEALLSGAAQFAVHSFKDVPAELGPEFVIGCVPKRADPRDVLVARGGGGLDALPEGARVGTSSLRRMLQLRAVRPDLEVVPLRGNVDTRLRKLDAGEVEAIVLAQAGLLRLGLDQRAREIIDAELMIPAPGQGALAIECLAGDETAQRALAPLDDRESSIAVACERGVMATVGGSCQIPFGAYARREEGRMRVTGFLAAADGSGLRRAQRQAAWPSSHEEARSLGEELGRELLGV
jgi:hydroxymethylbilane synthase